MITIGAPLDANRRARRRRPRSRPSTPASTIAPVAPWRRSSVDRLPVGRAPAGALVRAEVDGELRGVARTGREAPRRRRRHAGGEARVLERDETSRHRPVDVVERGLDATAGIDDEREQREVRGDVGEPLRMDAAVEPEALDAAQQRRGRHAAPLQARISSLAGELGARRDRLAEVDGQLERVGDHPSAPPSSQPAPVGRQAGDHRAEQVEPHAPQGAVLAEPLRLDHPRGERGVGAEQPGPEHQQRVAGHGSAGEQPQQEPAGQVDGEACRTGRRSAGAPRRPHRGRSAPMPRRRRAARRRPRSAHAVIRSGAFAPRRWRATAASMPAARLAARVGGRHPGVPVLRQPDRLHLERGEGRQRPAEARCRAGSARSAWARPSRSAAW